MGRNGTHGSDRVISEIQIIYRCLDYRRDGVSFTRNSYSNFNRHAYSKRNIGHRIEGNAVLWHTEAVTPVVRLSPRGVTPAGCGVGLGCSLVNTPVRASPAPSSRRHLSALAKPLAKANAARISILCKSSCQCSCQRYCRGTGAVRPLIFES
jgi:hypothetical protein